MQNLKIIGHARILYDAFLSTLEAINTFQSKRKEKENALYLVRVVVLGHVYNQYARYMQIVLIL